MLSYKDIQSALVIMDKFAYTGKIDGLLGPKTHEAIKKILEKRAIGDSSWGQGRRLIAIQQLIMKDVGIEVGTVDGLMGPQTTFATEQWQNRQRDLPSLPQPPSAGSVPVNA